jgi:spoIIIJ-associated protein
LNAEDKTMSQRFEGRNLDEALTLASQAYGVDRSRITHRVVTEKRGFLGGIKHVVIDAEIGSANAVAASPAPAVVMDEEPESAPILESVPMKESAPAVAPAAPRADRAPRARKRGRGGRRGESRSGGHGESGGNATRGRRGSFGDREQPALQSGDFEQFFTEVPEQGAESESAAAVRTWIEKVLAAAKFELQVRTEENDSQVIVRLYGPDAKRMLERHGEVLDALQVLVNKSLGGRSIEKDIELDCEGFKDRRTGSLEQRARDLADKVRRERREQLLPAMTPIERRIIHIALRDDADVTTESRGDGFLKRVAIVLRSDQQQSADSSE